MEYNQSPYVNKPEQMKKHDDSMVSHRLNPMAKAASTLGILSIVATLTMMIYPSIILGAMAIILALLSRGRDRHLSDKASSGMTTGIIGLSVNIIIAVTAVMLLFGDNPFKSQINDLMKEMYGQTYDDMLEDAMDGSFDLEYSDAFPYK
ncbi:MAG: hypothetical protein ACI4C2_00870 [Lachnospiraceae bacterium]|nr:hypothetical protein [Lachnospiraceae bacterium]MDY4126085.1 hypothetical protein [Lachnospiraceae bacterium]